MKFSDLRAIDVNSHVEKKQNLNYLSWAWAVDTLLTLDNDANWEYLPHQKWGDTVMVFCRVTAFGRARTAQLPVMDHRNKAVQNPDAFQVNVAMQRCLAKAIALHGIGLYIYAGEDLPPAENAEDTTSHEVVSAVGNHVVVDAEALKLRETVRMMVKTAGANSKLILESLGISVKSFSEIPPDEYKRIIDSGLFPQI